MGIRVVGLCGADPNTIATAANQASQAKARRKKAFGSICAHDIRYGNDGPIFDEALNTAAQRAAWTKDIAEGPEYVRFVTYNDFSEIPTAPSAANRYTILDINTYFITKWKTGQYPTITRDGLYISHRSQTLTATMTGPQTNPDIQRARPNQSTVRDYIEILSFLTAPATVSVIIGSRT